MFRFARCAGVLQVAILCALASPGKMWADEAVDGVEAIGMTVSDLERSIAFYTDVLGFRKTDEIEIWGGEYERLVHVFGARARVARLGLGREVLELTEYLAPRGRPFPVDSRSHDAWFQHIAIIVRDMKEAYAHLRRHRVEHASTGPQTIPAWNPAAGGIEAFYFRDPDGHFLEVLRFPAGKGDPRWHRPTETLFLGIDHTAIVVRDTEASLRFYRDALGLRVVGESENSGTEQEHLNNVFGARLRITTLRGDRGPGIELLEYLAPRDGRPRPHDARACDLLHWQTGLAVRDLAGLTDRLREARARLVSPGPVRLPDARLGFLEGLTVADPDGHVVRLATSVPRVQDFNASRSAAPGGPGTLQEIGR